MHLATRHFAIKIYCKYNDTNPPDKIRGIFRQQCLRLFNACNRQRGGTWLIASTAALVIHPTAKIQLTQIIYCGRGPSASMEIMEVISPACLRISRSTRTLNFHARARLIKPYGEREFKLCACLALTTNCEPGLQSLSDAVKFWHNCKLLVYLIHSLHVSMKLASDPILSFVIP